MKCSISHLESLLALPHVQVRFPVLLSPQEKEIARMVCLAFGQRVCGFDLLRSEKGKSYVCDVNGWSFVKNSKKYYDDTAGIIRTMLMSQLAPHRLAVQPDPALWTFALEEEDGSGHTGDEAGIKGVGSYLVSEPAGVALAAPKKIATMTAMRAASLCMLQRPVQASLHMLCYG